MRFGSAELGACCASARWREIMLAAAPFPDAEAACTASDRALAALDWPDVEQALTAHPRIGQRSAGTGLEARWSRAEQAAAVTTDERLERELIAGNHAYEQRFGHVFLVCASGLSSTEVLSALRKRLGNDAATERGVVRDELRKIVRLRMAKLAGRS